MHDRPTDDMAGVTISSALEKFGFHMWRDRKSRIHSMFVEKWSDALTQIRGRNDLDFVLRIGNIPSVERHQIFNNRVNRETSGFSQLSSMLYPHKGHSE
jgi:hypothetical protein